jgi:hypothetical protein
MTLDFITSSGASRMPLSCIVFVPHVPPSCVFPYDLHKLLSKLLRVANIRSLGDCLSLLPSASGALPLIPTEDWHQHPVCYP